MNFPKAPRESRDRTTSLGGARNIDGLKPIPVGFDFQAVYSAVDGDTADPRSLMAEVLRDTFDWVATGDTAAFNRQPALNRLVAACCYLEVDCFKGRSIAAIAASLGLSRALLNKYVRALNLRFGVYARGQKTSVRRRREEIGNLDPSRN